MNATQQKIDMTVDEAYGELVKRFSAGSFSINTFRTWTCGTFTLSHQVAIFPHATNLNHNIMVSGDCLRTLIERSVDQMTNLTVDALATSDKVVNGILSEVAPPIRQYPRIVTPDDAGDRLEVESREPAFETA